jgi:hypothetical protein
MAASASDPRTTPMRSFEPHRIAFYECDAWVSYYRRDWGRFMRAAIGLVREGFGMSWPRTIRGAYMVLRANQLWAPNPDNDPVAAQTMMRRFFSLVNSAHHLGIDVDEAARLEVNWWRVHRELQYCREPDGYLVQPLTDALADAYAHVYSIDPGSVRAAAALRAEAMVHSDRWVREGGSRHSPLLVDELTCLARSYGALLETVRTDS